MTYYNEIDDHAVAWLENLIAAGHISAGSVDSRSIKDVRGGDIGGGCAHFFAGIGGWDLALRLAGWPDDVPVWTGSCPCQPFSAAGKRKGIDDERHLWPEWFRIIRECRPPVIFGEQVASKDGLAWLDLVSADLEGAGYAVGAADLPAAGVEAPHKRQRLYFVAIADGDRRERSGLHLRAWGPQQGVSGASGGGADGPMGDPGGARTGRDTGAVPGAERGARLRAVGDSVVAASADGPVADLEWLPCLDGKFRPTQPGLHPLVDGLPRGVDGLRPSRSAMIRGYGNAIVPQVAAAFIRAVMES